MRRLCTLLAIATLSVWSVALNGPRAAHAAAPPATMTGETFSAGNSFHEVYCDSGTGNFTYQASGVAAGPYPGTFTETGSGTITGKPGVYGLVTAFSATFTVYSPSGNVLVTGKKVLDTTVPRAIHDCYTAPNTLGALNIPTTYEAKIYTPTGNYRDRGTSLVLYLYTDRGSPPEGTRLQESFTSSLVQPALISPTDKEQCKHGGWRDYPQFKNQGDCVSFVATGGKNGPG